MGIRKNDAVEEIDLAIKDISSIAKPLKQIQGGFESFNPAGSKGNKTGT